MLLGRVLVAVLSALLLVSCSSVPGPTATTTVTVSAAQPSPDPSASASTTPTATPEVPTAVPLAGALDVSKWSRADFASPSGRIWCDVSADNALCHFPNNYQAVIPPGTQICPNEDLDVTGVVISTAVAQYFCSGDPSAFPTKGSQSVAWHLAAGYPFVDYNGFTLAVLPYDKSLSHGVFACASAEAGVTCSNSTTKHGFKMRAAGVVFF